MHETQGGTDTAEGTALRRYSVPQAARLLGISERAVRRRIERQTIRAERTGVRWTVVLEAVSEPGIGGTSQPVGAPSDREGGTQAAAELRSVIREQQEQIVLLSRRVGELQAELGRARGSQMARSPGAARHARPAEGRSRSRPTSWLWRMLRRRRPIPRGDDGPEVDV